MALASNVAHGQEIRSTFEHLKALVDEVDASHRTFMFAEESELVEPYYYDAVSRLNDKMTQTRALIQGRRSQQHRFATLEHLVAKRIDLAERSIQTESVHESKGEHVPGPRYSQDATMDDIHRLIQEAIDEEDRTLAELSEKRAALGRSTTVWAGGGTVLFLTFVLGSSMAYRLDHSGRRKVEADLKASEAKQHMILTALPVVTYAAKGTGDFGALWVSANIRNVSGFPNSAFLENPALWAARLHPDDRERVLSAFDQIEKTEQIAIEYRWQVADGTYRWFHDNAVLQDDSDGTGKQLAGVWLDITTQREAEDRLRQVNERLSALVSASPVGIVILDEAGTCQLWNPAAERMFGWTEDEVLGRPLPTIAPEQQDEHRRLRERVMNGNAFTDMELVRSRKDGRRIHISLSTAPLRDRTGTISGLIGLMVDMSQRKQMEQQLSESYVHLRALGKRLESVREDECARIAREIHDELGQTLTAAKIDLAWVAKHVSSSESRESRIDLRTRLDDVMRNIEITIQAVRQIATMLRPRILDELGLSAAIEWQSRDFEKRTGIACSVSVPPSPIPIGPEQATTLFRVFQEMLTNVARHASATRVSVRLAFSTGVLTLEVTDNGRGITDQELNSKTSLGLLGMRERAEQWGGKFAISGHLDRGTSASVEIPLAGGIR
ncbi:hypothetical protein YTPLAS18_05100 [Nitrospira sp.]|nr:hypothetical protein YTPLAS18_05100 [Nitrospira sp.]